MVDTWESPGREGQQGGLPHRAPAPSVELPSGRVTPDTEESEGAGTLGGLDHGPYGAPDFTHPTQRANDGDIGGGVDPPHAHVGPPGTHPDDFPWFQSRQEGLAEAILQCLYELTERLAPSGGMLVRSATATQLLTGSFTQPVGAVPQRVLNRDPDRRRAVLTFVGLAAAASTIAFADTRELAQAGAGPLISYVAAGPSIIVEFTTTDELWIAGATTNAMVVGWMVERGKERTIPNEGHMPRQGLDPKREKSARAAFAREYPAQRQAETRRWEKV